MEASNDCHQMIIGHEHAKLILGHLMIFFFKSIANHKSEDMLQQWFFFGIFYFLIEQSSLPTKEISATL